MAGQPHELFEELRATGIPAVILESGDREGWTFVCVVNDEVRVPEGEEGLLFMREFIRRNKRESRSADIPFFAGFVGFISYELGARWQGVKERPISYNDASAGLCKAQPEAHFVYVDTVAAFKKGETRKSFITSGEKEGRAVRMSQKYFDALAVIKEHILSGDTYQVNFSERFETPFKGDAFLLYRRLAAINPSPFQFFMETSEFALISNSPERLFRINADRTIETRPIKGTMPRGTTIAEDMKNARVLLKSAKDKAELAMIVDLERNDLGKICVPGSVCVTEKRTVEKYSHVIHTAANIRGALFDGCDWYDALRALFPGGSITGCPKKRTMEIIRELEEEPRGIYCGSAGYIDLSGRCDFNIMIRTLWLDKIAQPNTIVFRSGGGIVADSDPQKECEELLHKATAIMTALHENGAI